MSANNFILIDKRKSGYTVEECCASNGAGFGKLKIFKGFKKAAEYASKQTAEYGTHFSEGCFK